MILDRSQSRMVRTETAVSAAVNGIIPPAVIWALRAPPPNTVVGQNGLITAMLPATILPVLAITIIVSLLVRRRVRAGRGGRLDLSQPATFGLGRAPNNLLLRALLFAGLAVLLLLPIGLTAAVLLHATPLDRTSFAVFNVVYGVFTGVVVAPIVVLRALADPPAPASARA